MNKYNPNIHHRRSIRLKGYDYSQAGMYFITICCQNRAFMFGEIVGASLVDAPLPNDNGQNDNEKNDNGQNDSGQMILNDAGKMIVTQWLALTERFTNIELHEFVVMPNHFHGILEIVGASVVKGQPQGIAPTFLNVGVKDDKVKDVGDMNDEFKDVGDMNDGVKDVGDMNDEFKDVGDKNVGDIMGAFKSLTTVEYIRGVKELGWKPFNGKLWQRNYYEHIIRNEEAYQRIANYIVNNPAKWYKDKFYKK